jgi:DNA-binding IclR family transcriptional regulator
LTPARNVTADRAIEILLIFDQDNPVISAQQIMERLNISRSATYRFLQTLKSTALIEDESPGRYRLGPRILSLARIVTRGGNPLSEAAVPVMRQLSVELDSTVLLTRVIGNNVICVEREETARRVRISYERGQSLPVNAGAQSKALLAWLDPAELTRLLSAAELPRFTSATITDPEALQAEFAEIRQRGYAITYGEVDDHVIGIAAPVMEPKGRVVAGLGIAGLDHDLPPDRIPIAVKAVVNAARATSSRLELYMQ